MYKFLKNIVAMGNFVYCTMVGWISRLITSSQENYTNAAKYTAFKKYARKNNGQKVVHSESLTKNIEIPSKTSRRRNLSMRLHLSIIPHIHITTVQLRQMGFHFTVKLFRYRDTKSLSNFVFFIVLIKQTISLLVWLSEFTN